jgi:hypothetical protein
MILLIAAFRVAGIVGLSHCLWPICGFVCLLFAFFVDLEFELRVSCLQSSTLALEPHLQTIFLWLFWR